MVSHRPSPQATVESIANPPGCKRLTSRSQYRSCHIQTPDADERVAAIVVEDRYYSFFKLVKDQAKAVQLAAKLIDRGHEVVLTPTVKGDAVWIHEPEAWERKESVAHPNRAMTSATESNSKLWRILDAREYQTCQIRVPDVAKPLMAIEVGQQYYSFLRLMRNEAQAIELAERLAKKGHAARITRNAEFSIWVLESEATIWV